ncbi:hypothetical protein ES332_A04G029800v1 [Gossypium tomentosum]|uniref:Uncharacterized protein n=1 Tax=Gossypium tomentosum TaxID=34277 RepID=A0A5D2QTY1_GOSTO|nr:hypothetical protein ES332_A04G029800v1 [Gossypium tomentosum]
MEVPLYSMDFWFKFLIPNILMSEVMAIFIVFFIRYYFKSVLHGLRGYMWFRI